MVEALGSGGDGQRERDGEPVESIRFIDASDATLLSLAEPGVTIALSTAQEREARASTMLYSYLSTVIINHSPKK